ncbi:MAG: MBL fold metallo-hydrolase [Candidatus Sumerlaeia bacterium]
MNQFREKVMQTKVPENCLSIFWLEQSHFLFKTSAGTLIHVDPFLSRDVKPENHIYPKPLMWPNEAPGDYVFLTHDHRDHTDPHTLGPMRENNPECRFIGPRESVERCISEADIPPARLQEIKEGETQNFDGFSVKAVFSHDTANVPNTTHLGFIFDFGGLVVYHAGDTRSDVENYEAKLDPIRNLQPDALIVAINRKYNNPGPEGALRIVEMCKPHTIIPCHFDCFKDNTLDPQEFVDIVPEADRSRITVMNRGEVLNLSA